MGRRSRKRDASASPPPPRPQAPIPAAPAPPRAPTWRARMEESPKAPWSPFPLTELCILLAIVLITLGFLTSGGRRGALLGGGFILVTLAAGELAVREHFSGFRSHSSLLAGICAIVVAAPLYLTAVPQEVILGVALVVFGIAFRLFRRAFARRTGLGFRA